MSEAFTQVKKRLQKSKRLAVLTGAGVSAESGVPTFRGEQGLWRHFRAEDLATPEAFARDPELVWEWYAWRRELVAKCEPNPGHLALATWEARPGGLTLVTQNVDGLHALAGSTSPIEMHGNLWKVRCTSCHAITDDRRVPIPILPHCERCGSLLRPHIVWFGEGLDEAVLERTFSAFQRCDMALIIGTSGRVQPAASLAGVAKRNGAFVVEINPDATATSHVVDVALRGPAGEILPQLV